MKNLPPKQVIFAAPTRERFCDCTDAKRHKKNVVTYSDGHKPHVCWCPVNPKEAEDMGDAVREQRALEAVRTLIDYIGDDSAREGVKATPGRVLKAWREAWGKGYREPPPALTCFPEAGIDYDQMVIVKGINFYSTCEHHLAPFFGTADIAYIPNPKIGVLGISKLARVVEHYSRRLQVQERLTSQVASHLAKHISPNVAVIMRAAHMCMVSRGVMQPNAQTVTSALKGVFFHEPSARAEFLRLTQS